MDSFIISSIKLFEWVIVCSLSIVLNLNLSLDLVNPEKKGKSSKGIFIPLTTFQS